MRSILNVCLTLVAAAAAAAGFCALAGWGFHAREMAGAGIAALLGASAGLMPAMVNRDSPVETMMQASLAGTVLQMLICLGLGVLIWVGGLAKSPTAFAAWLMFFYWVSLAAVVTMLVGFIRRAAARPQHSKPLEA